MRAAVFDRFGPPTVLRVAGLPDPVPGPGEVRVRVRAAGVQPFDVAFRRGTLARDRASFPQQLGQEYAGVIDQLGPPLELAGAAPGPTSGAGPSGAGPSGAGPSGAGPGDPAQLGGAPLAVGDAVLGSTMFNGQASAVVVPVASVVRKPAHLDFPTAAGLVAAAQTASGALRELGVGPGDVLLVHAAAGSVGTLAVQLARLAGATVIGTASPANHDYLRQIGAVPVAYGKDLPQSVRLAAERLPGVVLDAAGGEAIAQSVALGVPPSRIGTIVDDRAALEYGARVVRAPRDPARLAEVAELVARGVLSLPIRAYPLAEVAAAHAAVESRHGRGKVVLIMEGLQPDRTGE
jgi:NADPH:quinone reductase-like Zn-dependent oxidoreductase